LLAREPIRRDVRAAVGEAVRDGLALDRHDLAFVTQRLHMSPRVLQRRIAALGTSFRAIRDGVRFELALSLVAHGDAPIGEIAGRLGYAETAAFSRAFTRRFRQSPRAARRAASASARGRTAAIKG
jgi:AraC-like DNA-binding protein